MNYWKTQFIKNSGTIYVLAISFIIAILLSILPVPYRLQWIMPNWLVLVLIYWMIFTPEVIGLGFTFILGMLIDLLLGNLLGFTSLSLMPVTFFADRLGVRFRNLAIPQQFLIVLTLISLNHLLRLWLQFYTNHPVSNLNYWLVIPSSVCVWPLVCGSLNLFRKVIKFC